MVYGWTHSVAGVAVAADVRGITTANINAGVLLRITPRVPLGLRHVVDRNRAAGDGEVGVGGAVLSNSEAGKGRGGDDDRRVAHGELLYGAKSINACKRESAGDQQ